MESACVYQQTTLIHELTQGIEMAKQLRLNLNSVEARELLIHQILYSYDKALVVLKSAEQPQASHLPESSLPKSSTTTGSPQSTGFEFDQNVVFRKRKASPQREDEVRIWSDNRLEGSTNDGYSYGQKEILDLDPNFKFSDDNLYPLYFPNYLDDELLQGYYSPPFISPATSESNYLSDWSSSSPLDLDLDPNFKFNNSLF